MSRHPPRHPLTLALLLASCVAGAAEPPSLEALAARLQALERREGGPDAAPLTAAELDLRLRALEQRAALADAGIAPASQALAVTATPPAPAAAVPAAPAASNAPKVTLAGDKGLVIASADGNAELKVRGLVQADGRFFLDDDAVPQNDTFLFRRIRPTLEGRFGLVGFRLTPEFAGDSASIVDAYVDLRFDPRATVRIGKVKGPVGLERLQSGGALAFVERGLPTELVPNRDLGVQLQGAVAGGKVDYTVGVYNGAVDGRDSPTTNPDDDFEFAGRVFVEPWKGGDGALAGLGFGIAGSVGEKHGSGNNFLPRFRTPGQAQFFGYRNTVFAEGDHVRWSPQASWYTGPLGVTAEYVRSTQDVALVAGGPATSIANTAWQATAGWVLTGEKASARGVIPNEPFTGDGAGWGAFELVARYGRLDVDEAAFPLFADAGTAASAATTWGLGLNWMLTGNLKLVASYTRTRFDGGSAGGDREDEQAIFTRAQLSF